MPNNYLYEQYMRNSLGLNNNLSNNMDNNQENNYIYTQESDYLMYPEIYRIIYPSICKACLNIQDDITEDLIDKITEEIYANIENVPMPMQNRNSSKTNNNLEQLENNRYTNYLLKDLIKILVIRELFGNRVNNNLNQNLLNVKQNTYALDYLY